MDRLSARLDRWLTTQPDSSLACPECETLLDAPISVDTKTETFTCTGSVRVIQARRSPEVAAIVGPGTDLVEYVECQTFAFDNVAHSPHTEVVTVTYVEHYTCGCGWQGTVTTT